ncbi:MAG: hypothetical protein ACR2J8_14110 [Thermomicrobiales bacterium]
MGADLYLITPDRKKIERQLADIEVKLKLATPDEKQRLTKQRQTVSDRLFTSDNYFRDSYNSSSLFWQIGLSWWQDLPKYCGPGGYNERETLTTLREPVIYAAGARKLVSDLRQHWEEHHHKIASDHFPYFEEKYHAFRAMLERCIEDNLTIVASI